MQSSVNSPSVTWNQTHPILMPPRLRVALLGLDLFRFGIRIMLCKIVVSNVVDLRELHFSNLFFHWLEKFYSFYGPE